MTAPLYSGCDKPTNCGKEGNHGLWFERFFDQYDPRNWDVLKPTNHADMGNAHWLLKHFGNKKVGDDGQLASHTQAQTRLAASLQGQSHVFKASWHFVTGMGNAHPVENGFAWHPTLGVPYLTGAAVKGLIRSYIETHLDTEDPNNPDKQALLLHWFGSTDKDPTSEGYQAQAGALIFFDALPVKPVTLGVDIMTPHMGKWYGKGGGDSANQPETVPADWHDPVPVPFLVAKDITLQFSFALRQYPGTDGKREPVDFSDVLLALANALGQMGAGGKTATGYGGLVVDTQFQQALEKQERQRLEQAKQVAEAAANQARLASLSPLEQALEGLGQASGWVKALETKRWQGDELHEAARLIQQRMQQQGLWAETSAAKKPEKDTKYQRTLTVKKFL